MTQVINELTLDQMAELFQRNKLRFFNDRKVRAVWDEGHSKWWFSATDIVRAINDEEDYVKAGNYWRWLKKKFSAEGIQLVSVTHEFKFEAPDGKQRAADAMDAECVQILAKNYPNNRANTFLDWFTYSVEMNVAHPFMEGNGRSTRIWLDLIFKKRLGKCVDWSKINKRDYLSAMIESQMDSTKIRALLKSAMTDKIDDREIFMKGIDYSYYYEQEE